MKYNITAFFTAVFMAMLIFSACNSPEKKPESAAANADSASMQPVAADTTVMQQDWEKFKADALQKIKEDDDSIQAFKMKVSKSGQKMHAKYDREIEKLEQKEADLKKRLEEYKAGGKEKWEVFKKDFNSDMDSIGEQVKSLGAHKEKH